ncbi:hypothetical protein D3C79_48100 [compost metagenome]
MTIANAKIERYNETHILGVAELTHSKGTEEVRFVAPKPVEGFDPHGSPELDASARYFSSPMIAHTNFDDLSNNVALTPAFIGRDLGAMQAHLVKNFK